MFFTLTGGFFFLDALETGQTKWGTRYGHVTKPIYKDATPTKFRIVTGLWLITFLGMTAATAFCVYDLVRIQKAKINAHTVTSISGSTSGLLTNDYETHTILKSDDKMTLFPKLPDRFCPKVVSYPECSYGAVRVTLVLSDGRRIRDVIIGGDSICKIGQKLIKSDADLEFSVSDIKDVLKG